jgi:hypothetical protein
MLFAAQRKILELRRKAPHFVQPRSEKVLNREQSIVFCSTAQGNVLELRTKALCVVRRAAKILEL